MITSLALRVVHYFSFPHYDPYTHHYPLQFQADSLSAGILISWYYHFQYEGFKHWVSKGKSCHSFIGYFIIPIFIFPYYDKWTFTIGLTSIWLGYSGIVMLLIILPAEQKEWNDFFHNKPLFL
jgi:peptidoglycan/LPS O-acetylase OafA/YrhL